MTSELVTVRPHQTPRKCCAESGVVHDKLLCVLPSPAAFATGRTRLGDILNVALENPLSGSREFKMLCSLLLERVMKSGLLTQFRMFLILRADKMNPPVFILP